MRPSLRQIEAFLTTAELGNFSRAAERLCMSQPALSQAVRDLEAMLDLPLFTRTTRRVTLTDAGHRFRDHALKGMEEIDRALRTARDTAALRLGHLRLAAPPLLAATIVPRAIAAFVATHPGVTFALADTGTEDILTRLRDGRADIGFGTFPPSGDNLARRIVLRDALTLAAPPDHPLAGTSPQWRDLAAYPLIPLTRDSGIRLLVELGFERATTPFRPAFEVAQITTALALTRAGLGLAILPGYALRDSDLAAIPIAGPPIGREVVILTARDRTLPPAALPFADTLARLMAGQATGVSPRV